MMLSRIALVMALIAIALGIYVRFVLDNDGGTIAITIGAIAAALSAVAAAKARKGSDGAR